MRYFKESSVIPESKVTGRPEINTTRYSEIINEYEVLRHVCLSDTNYLIKFDLEHDEKFEMREYESHIDLRELKDIEKAEFEKIWKLAEYKEYEKST